MAEPRRRIIPDDYVFVRKGPLPKIDRKHFEFVDGKIREMLRRLGKL